MKIGSLFSGAGLGDLGFMWAGFEHAWFCEKDEYAKKILSLRWPGTNIYDDVRELYGNSIEPVQILTGGFPCQPFSSAARGKNIISKDRKGELVRLAEELRPMWVVGENVNRRPVDEVARQLRGIGYGTSVFRARSDQVGADHQRGRWWVCAYSDMHGEFHMPIDAEMEWVSELRQSVRGWSDYSRAIRVPDGSPDRMDRLRCTGNGQDPFVTYIIGSCIKKLTVCTHFAEQNA